MNHEKKAAIEEGASWIVCNYGFRDEIGLRALIISGGGLDPTDCEELGLTHEEGRIAARRAVELWRCDMLGLGESELSKLGDLVEAEAEAAAARRKEAFSGQLGETETEEMGGVTI